LFYGLAGAWQNDTSGDVTCSQNGDQRCYEREMNLEDTLVYRFEASLQSLTLTLKLNLTPTLIAGHSIPFNYDV